MAKINTSKFTNRDILVTGVDPSTGEYLTPAQRKAAFRKRNINTKSVFGKPGAIVKVASSTIAPSTPAVGKSPSSNLEERVGILEGQFASLSKFLVDDAKREKKEQKKLQVAQDRGAETESRRQEENRLEKVGRAMSDLLLSPLKAVGGAVKGILQRVMEFFVILFAGWLTDKGLQAIKEHALGNFDKLEELGGVVLKNLGIVAATFVGINAGLLALPALIGGVIKAIAGIGVLIVKLLLSPVGLLSLAGMGLSAAGEASRGLGDWIRGDSKTWWRNVLGNTSDVFSGTVETIGAPFRGLFEFARFGGNIKKSNQVMASVDANIRESFRKGLNSVDFLNVVPDEKGGFGVLGAYGEAGTQALESVRGGSRETIQPQTPAAPSMPKTSTSPSPQPASRPRSRRSQSDRGESSGASVKMMHHPDTGSGYGVPGVKDSYGRPAVFSKGAAIAFARMIKDSKGQVSGRDIASSKRSRAKNAAVGGAKNSKHMYGNAMDIHGRSGRWIRAHGRKYGWVPNDYSGSHGGHFEFRGGGGDGLPPADAKSKGSQKPSSITPSKRSAYVPEQLPDAPPNIVYKKVGAQGGGMGKQPLKTGSATDVPRIASSNPDNFYTLYSHVSYNVVT